MEKAGWRRQDGEAGWRRQDGKFRMKKAEWRRQDGEGRMKKAEWRRQDGEGRMEKAGVTWFINSSFCLSTLYRNIYSDLGSRNILDGFR